MLGNLDAGGDRKQWIVLLHRWSSSALQRYCSLCYAAAAAAAAADARAQALYMHVLPMLMLLQLLLVSVPFFSFCTGAVYARAAAAAGGSQRPHQEQGHR
jgi:hypothetical protein